MKRQVHIPRLHLLWLAVALVAGLALTLTVMSAVALSASPEGPENAPGGIEGFLHEPGGTPSGGWIHIRDVNGQPWMGADANPVNGSFSILNLPPGMYILRAFAPPGSLFAGSLPVEVEVLSGQMTPVDLFLTDVRISGYVRECDAIPEKRIEGATVAAHRSGFLVWDSTNITGEFKLGGMNVGVPYTLEVLPPPGSEYVSPEPKTVVPISNSVILEMCIPPTNVVGIVHHPDGYPLNDAWAVLWNDSYWKETRTDVSGTFTFRGVPVPPGEFWLHVGPPWGPQGAGLIAIDPFTITIAQPDTLVDVGVLTLQRAFKTVHGRVVVAGTDVGVPDAEVHARQLDGPGYAGGPTNVDGGFNLSVTGGEWHVSVEPLRPPAPWIFPGPPAWVFFAQNTDPETRTVNLEVIPTNATVTGRVVCPDGAPCDGNPPYEDILPEDIWVELRSDGIRNDAGLGPDYRFEIPIPDGSYELVVHLGAHLLQGPGPIPVSVGPGATYDVGDVRLLLKDARITGRVINEFGSGVAGVAVASWQPEGVGRSLAETDASGFYTMPVIGGEWLVEPRPGPDLPFVFRYHPRVVFVHPHGEMRGVDFELSWADARIQGFAVDARDDHRLWGLDGWARAEQLVAPDKAEFFSDAPMRDSTFDLKARGGYTYYVGLDLPPHAPYVSGGADPLPVAPGEWLTDVAVRLEPKDAAIEGTLFVIAGTPPAPAPARGIWARVFGEDEHGHWTVAGVDPASARYELGVVSGTWHLRAWVDPASGYAAPPTVTVVTAHSGPVPTIQDFEVWPIASSISGHVQKPDGTPLPGVFVFAKGESPFAGYFETHAESGPDGAFELLVPEGGYVVGAALPGDELKVLGWLNPRPIDVPWVSAANPAIDQDLRFRELDGEIHGTIRFAPGIVATATHPAYVWGWTNTGEWAETTAMTSSINTFTYTLRVVSGTVWHVGAVYEDRENGVFYESPEANGLVPPTPPVGQATQDLKLGGPWPLPQPFIVSFDAAQMQTIIMPDGVELLIPPGALVDSGTVTLFIFPTQEMRPEPGREIIGAGYKIWAIDQNGKEITQFKKNVVMTFSYPPDPKLPPGISEHMLVPVYYSTLVGHWTLADSYVVDTAHNEITLQLNHFSKFSVMSTGPAEERIYLPLVLKSFGG
ncbi:MAG TPA: hypothetical protein VMY40_05810 [Anaerolineae bacterium]|nr:hypothetical protein [Anaerolineae bacterium]